ncbi:hypothetical protein BGX26_012020 [Mortierella sp. AD094]|nr:hypothetical protein BGX26_012020 [Mortierella sp. AD094]
MAETTKLAQRMKLNDGSIASTSKSNTGSKKRKNANKRGDRYEDFAGYGADADLGDLQDENRNIGNTFGSGGVNDKSAEVSQRRNHPDTNGGPPPAKKQKPPQPAPPINSAFLNYFSRVPLGSQASSLQNSPALVSEARQSLKVLIELPIPKSKARSVVSASKTDVETIASPHDQLKESKRTAASDNSTGRAPSIDVYEDKEAMPKEPNARSKLTVDPTLATKASPNKQKVKEDTKDVKEEAKSKKKEPTSRPSVSKSRTRAESDSVDITDENAIPGDTDQHKSNRSMLDFFKYRPKAAVLPEVAQSNKLVVEITNYTASASDQSLDSQHDKELLNENSDPGLTEPTETAISSEGNRPESGNIAAEKQELSQDQAIETIENLSQPQAPRRRRLVRASDLKPKKYCESSGSASDEEAEQKANQPSKGSKNAHPKLSLRRPKKETSPKLELGPETRPEPELEPEPELRPEPEPEHLIASRRIMRNFLGVSVPTPPSLTSTLSKLAKESEDISQPIEPARSQLPITRPVLKTYSKAKNNRANSKKKYRQKNAFSDSDRSDTDPDSNGSDDDLSDFIETKEIEKPDPNQKSITDMFSKGPLRSTSYSPIVRPRRKKNLTPASRAILSGGLSNVSNTCYLNSVLQTLRNTDDCAQSLLAIQEKMRALEKSQQSQVKATEYQRSLFDHALEVFRALDSREESSGSDEQDEKSIYPTKVIRTLHQFDDILKAVIQLGQQSDSEALVPKDWQPINDLFQVGTQTVTNCQRCSSISVNTDRGIDLTVQIDAETPTLIRDLDWGISATMKMEHMKDDNRRFCEKCSSKEDAHVYHYFTSLPKIMILRLQRYNFKEGAVKIQNGVSCTETLSFAKWMSQDYKGPNPNYELCAIIVHRGRVITSGHYYVYIKKNVEIETEITEPDGETRTEKKAFRWLKYNDSYVDPVSDEDMARVFSGNVNSQSSSSEVLGDSTSQTVGSSENGKKEGLAGNNLFDVDMATPYVYIYRRIDDA